MIPAEERFGRIEMDFGSDCSAKTPDPPHGTKQSLSLVAPLYFARWSLERQPKKLPVTSRQRSLKVK
jgi:hypothetical protein